jgi:putative membrane protein
VHAQDACVTRIDAVVTAAYAVTLSAPLIMYASVRLVRRGRHNTHRLIQCTHLVVCWIAVLALELRIRLDGGTGMFIAQAAPDLRAIAQQLLVVHIAIAVITYVAWTWLAIASHRRFAESLPGSFSRRHRRAGTLVFAGLCFTAASATGMYVLVFVA